MSPAEEEYAKRLIAVGELMADDLDDCPTYIAECLMRALRERGLTLAPVAAKGD